MRRMTLREHRDARTRETLIQARQLLRKGFAHGTLKNCDDQFCSIGAVNEVLGLRQELTHRDREWRRVIKTLWRALPQYRTQKYTKGWMADEVWAYNDSHTQDEVIAVFDYAIDLVTPKVSPNG